MEARFDDLSSREAGRAMEEEAVRVSLEEPGAPFRSCKTGWQPGTLTLAGAVFAIADGVLSVLGDDGEFAAA